MTDNDAHSPAERLRLWAQGLRPLEAAAWLLTHALGGRLLTSPWVRETPAGLLRIDPNAAASESGHLSGGERRVLAIVTSLVSDSHPVDLGDAISGVDPTTAQLILTALGHAAGLLDATTGSAPAASVNAAMRELEATLRATQDDVRTESEQEALDHELDEVLGPLIDRLQMYRLASGITAETITEIIHDRLVADHAEDEEI